MLSDFLDNGIDMLENGGPTSAEDMKSSLEAMLSVGGT